MAVSVKKDLINDKGFMNANKIIGAKLGKKTLRFTG